MNGLTLAYLGDAYYEYRVRAYLIEQQLTKVNELHQTAIRFTSSKAQAHIIDVILNQNILSDDELDFYKRGRNASGSGRKNVDRQTYSYATGFEALIGGTYLSNPQRADELVDEAIKIIVEGVQDGENS